MKKEYLIKVIREVIEEEASKDKIKSIEKAFDKVDDAKKDKLQELLDQDLKTIFNTAKKNAKSEEAKKKLMAMYKAMKELKPSKDDIEAAKDAVDSMLEEGYIEEGLFNLTDKQRKAMMIIAGVIALAGNMTQVLGNTTIGGSGDATEFHTGGDGDGDGDKPFSKDYSVENYDTGDELLIHVTHNSDGTTTYEGGWDTTGDGEVDKPLDSKHIQKELSNEDNDLDEFTNSTLDDIKTDIADYDSHHTTNTGHKNSIAQDIEKYGSITSAIAMR